MESTSVYWTTIYFILEKAGIEVCPVNPKKFRMMPGRKTDVADSQWLQILHLYGLLRGSFYPVPLIAELRTYMRERDSIIKERSTFVQRMQKNPKRHKFIFRSNHHFILLFARKTKQVCEML
jgi:transposase